MNQRNLINLVLALVLAALVALVVFEPGKKEPAPKTLLTTIKPAEIQHVVIEQARHPAIELNKVKGEWQMVKPFDIAANDLRVDNILAILETTSLAHYPDTAVDLSRLKLDKPDLVLYLDTHKLSFGTTEALAGNRYVKIGNMVHLIKDRFSYLVRGQATAFISPALLPRGAEITALTLPTMTLTSSATGWQVKPDKTVKSSDQLNQLVDEWRYARATRVTKMNVSTAEASTISTSPITVKMTDNTMHFQLARTRDEIVFSRPDKGLSYHFQTDMGEKLLKLPTHSPDTTRAK